jgi:DNA repair protein RAD50
MNRIQKVDLPALVHQIKEQERSIPRLIEKAEEVRRCHPCSDRHPSNDRPQTRDKLTALRKEAKDISVMRSHASHVSRTQREISRLKDDIASIERDLSYTGSTRTTDAVQSELDSLSNDMYVSSQFRIRKR